MKNHDPMYGDNITCEACCDVFDARNDGDTVKHNGVDKFVCGACLDLSDEELKEALSQVVEIRKMIT